MGTLRETELRESNTKVVSNTSGGRRQWGGEGGGGVLS